VQVDLLELEKLGLIKRHGKARALTWTLNKKNIAQNPAVLHRIPQYWIVYDA